MFNSQEYQYVKDLVYTNYNNGYKFYMCTTVTSTNDNRIIECLFSKKDIVINSSFATGIDTKFYTIYSQNYQTNNDVYVTSNNASISLNQHEYFYTNSSNEYPDIFAQEVYQETFKVNHSVSYNLTLNDIYLIILLISILVTMIFVKPFFRLK